MMHRLVQLDEFDFNLGKKDEIVSACKLSLKKDEQERALLLARENRK